MEGCFCNFLQRFLKHDKNFKVSNRNTRKKCKISSKLTINFLYYIPFSSVEFEQVNLVGVIDKVFERLF